MTVGPGATGVLGFPSGGADLEELGAATALGALGADGLSGAVLGALGAVC